MAQQVQTRDIARGINIRPTDILIAVMGVTGAGKSSLISLCSEQKVEIGHNLQAFRQRLYTYLTESYSNNVQLNGIIYLHRISDVRMQGSAKKNLLMFRKLCGKDALKNVILATTMWDKVTLAEGVEREAQLLDNPDFWGWMQSHGSIIRRHTGDRASAIELIDHFVRQNAHVVLELQRQMVEERKNLNETSVGIELQSEIAKEREKFQKNLEEVQHQLQEAMKKRDAEVASAMRELQIEYCNAMERLNKDQEELKISMQKLHEEKYREMAEKLQQQAEAHKRKVAQNETRHPMDPDASQQGERLGLESVSDFSDNCEGESEGKPPCSGPQQQREKCIKFKDAVGRKFTFPFHLVEKWSGIESVIKQAFMHVDVIGQHVLEGHYDLAGPGGEIILPSVWEHIIEPDWLITMHMWPLPEPPPPRGNTTLNSSRSVPKRPQGLLLPPPILIGPRPRKPKPKPTGVFKRRGLFT